MPTRPAAPCSNGWPPASSASARSSKDFDVSQPAISQHLGQLRKAGLVTERREGRNTYYAANPAGLDPLLGWLDRYRTFWPEKIERLKTVLKGMDQ